MDINEAYDNGYQDGLIRGREEGYNDARMELEAEFVSRIKKLYVELLELQARLSVIEGRV